MSELDDALRLHLSLNGDANPSSRSFRRFNGGAEGTSRALRFLGKDAVTDEVIQKIRRILSPAERKRLLKEAKYASTWVPDVVRRIAEDPSDG